MGLVKLHIYQHKPNETVIDTFSAKEWEDFVVITIDSPNLTSEVYNSLAEQIAQLTSSLNKTYVIIPKDMDIEMFGVTPNEKDIPSE